MIQDEQGLAAGLLERGAASGEQGLERPQPVDCEGASRGDLLQEDRTVERLPAREQPQCSSAPMSGVVSRGSPSMSTAGAPAAVPASMQGDPADRWRSVG